MLYTLGNTLRVGKRAKHIFDANGLEWTKVLECDTETGRILRFVTGPNGSILADGYEPRREEITTAAPLRVILEPINGGRPRSNDELTNLCDCYTI
jgi:hypothetical protein